MKNKTLSYPRKTLLLFCLLLSFSVNVMADKNRDIILKGGINISNLVGYKSYVSPFDEPNIGFNLGVYTQKSIADRIFIKLGTEYTMLGAQLDVFDSDRGPYKYIREKHQYSYLMLPIIFGYSIGKTVDLEVGTQLGYLVNGRIKSTYSFESPQKPDSVYIHVANLTESPLFNNGTNYYFNPVRIAFHLGANFKIIPQLSLHFAFLSDATDVVRSTPKFFPANQNQTNVILHNVSFQSSVCYYLRKPDGK